MPVTPNNIEEFIQIVFSEAMCNDVISKMPEVKCVVKFNPPTRSLEEIQADIDVLNPEDTERGKDLILEYIETDYWSQVKTKDDDRTDT